MRNITTVINLLLMQAMLMLNQQAWACAVCGTATEESKKAFIISTAALSIVPLLMIGGVIYYLHWANHRKHQPTSTTPPLQE